MKFGELLLSAICLGFIRNTHALAVMSVDLGSEWMKVGIVSPGVPMEIALNKESKRKTPAVLSIRDNIRQYGEDAQTVGVRIPKSSYGYLLDLLGKDINHPIVKLYQSRFPYYDIVENPERNTILFKHENDTFFSPEELIAQLLFKAKEFAESGAHQPIKECVLTVPGFFNQIERKSLLQSAKLANLKVLQLINDYTAVALNYGIYRSKDFNESAQYIMFYDMGATSTTATVVSYRTIKTKERGYVETHPEVQIIGIGFDRTLGGLEFQIRLRDYLAKKFNELKKTSNDVFKNPRAMAKLFKEAGRLKNVLSANSEHYAQVEGLIDEQDFKLLVTRNEFEDLSSDLFERVSKPVKEALKTAQLTTDVLSQVVLFGGGTRVPKVQEILQNIVGQDLAKNLNTDEAATMGAVYKAADLSTGFQVKKFITKDAVIYPIQVLFERESDGKMKQVKRTLFGLMNPYPQKKIITFNKHTNNFKFTVNYAELEHLTENEVRYLGGLNLTEVQVTGVEEAFKKHSDENNEYKGIKAHFQMDESGLLKLLNVELHIEKTVTEAEDEGTLSKLGSTISKLFGGDEEKPVHEEPESETPAAKPENTTTKTESNDTTLKNDTSNAKETKPKLLTIKEVLESQIKPLTIETLNKEQLTESQKKLQKLEEIENEITNRVTALNNLESFVIDVQTKLDEDEYSEATTHEEKDKILKLTTEISEWLYEEGEDSNTETYEKKLEELKAETNPLFARVWEHRERPEALEALNSMLNHSTTFLKTAKNLTSTGSQDKEVFTEREVEILEKAINDTVEWQVKAVDTQKKLQKYEPVYLTVKLITEKMASLDREVKYLLNKLRLWKPKVVEKPAKKKQAKEEQQNKTEKESTVTEPEEAEVETEAADQEEQTVDSENVAPSKTEENTDKTHSEL